MQMVPDNRQLFGPHSATGSSSTLLSNRISVRLQPDRAEHLDRHGLFIFAGGSPLCVPQHLERGVYAGLGGRCEPDVRAELPHTDEQGALPVPGRSLQGIRCAGERIRAWGGSRRGAPPATLDGAPGRAGGPRAHPGDGSQPGRAYTWDHGAVAGGPGDAVARGMSPGRGLATRPALCRGARDGHGDRRPDRGERAGECAGRGQAGRQALPDRLGEDEHRAPGGGGGGSGAHQGRSLPEAPAGPGQSALQDAQPQDSVRGVAAARANQPDALAREPRTGLRRRQLVRIWRYQCPRHPSGSAPPTRFLRVARAGAADLYPTNVGPQPRRLAGARRRLPRGACGEARAGRPVLLRKRLPRASRPSAGSGGWHARGDAPADRGLPRWQRGSGYLWRGPARGERSLRLCLHRHGTAVVGDGA